MQTALLWVLIFLSSVSGSHLQYPTYNIDGYDINREFTIYEKRKIVYRSIGEVGPDNEVAIQNVIATMMCRIDNGYGGVDDILGVYFARDYHVSDVSVNRLFHTYCLGAKYALSIQDVKYLKIPDDEPRVCIDNTCFFLNGVDNR